MIFTTIRTKKQYLLGKGGGGGSVLAGASNTYNQIVKNTKNVLKNIHFICWY